MKIAIVGAGAMGSLFGALLAESGEDTVLCDIWTEHVDAINANGLEVEWDGSARMVRLRATADPFDVGRAEMSEVDLAVIFVKSSQTFEAAQTAAQIIGEGGMVMTLQNGMGNADVIAEFIAPFRIVAGTTAHGATVIGPGKIRHAGKGPTVIGIWSSENHDPARVREIADRFTRAGIETKAVTGVREVIWEKLLVNVGINAITALTGIKNGQLLDLENTRRLSREAVEEAAAVARARGIQIRDDIADHVFGIASATSPNRSSMGQDVDNRRQTEIGAINGFIVSEAEKLNLDAPVNRTLTTLIETLQAHYENK
jgi:2-dehydropantoate 2-reductase